MTPELLAAFRDMLHALKAICEDNDNRPLFDRLKDARAAIERAETAVKAIPPAAVSQGEFNTAIAALVSRIGNELLLRCDEKDFQQIAQQAFFLHQKTLSIAKGETPRRQ